MDVPEAEFDIKLQKISVDLLGDFDRSLPNFLWKPDGHGGLRVRSRVRAKETFRLTSTVSELHIDVVWPILTIFAAFGPLPRTASIARSVFAKVDSTSCGGVSQAPAVTTPGKDALFSLKAIGVS